MCKWIIALSKYDLVAKSIAPKRARLEEAEAELAVQQDKLKDKLQHLEHATKEYEQVSKDLEDIQQACSELESDINDKKRRLELAELLIINLGAERIQWASDLAELEATQDQTFT